MTLLSEQGFLLSSRKRRIAAFLIDHFILTFLMVAIAFLIAGPKFMDEDNPETMNVTLMAVMLPGFLVYFSKDAIRGISAGRWIMGIMVRDTVSPNEIPSFGRLFIRNLLLIIWPVEFIALAVSQEKKRLGDRIAKTTVVKNTDKPGKLPRILALVAIGITIFTFTFLFAATAMKNSDAYQVAIQEIETNTEIKDVTGGIKGFGMMPSGNITISNGQGESQLEITVLGNEKDLQVKVHLTKKPGGKWEIMKINY